jgi:hypothetical protein
MTYTGHGNNFQPEKVDVIELLQWIIAFKVVDSSENDIMKQSVEETRCWLSHNYNDSVAIT